MLFPERIMLHFTQKERLSCTLCRTKRYVTLFEEGEVILHFLQKDTLCYTLCRRIRYVTLYAEGKVMLLFVGTLFIIFTKKKFLDYKYWYFIKRQEQQQRRQ